MRRNAEKPVTLKDQAHADIAEETRQFIAEGGKINCVGWGETGEDKTGKFRKNIVITPRGK